MCVEYYTPLFACITKANSHNLTTLLAAMPMQIQKK